MAGLGFSASSDIAFASALHQCQTAFRLWRAQALCSVVQSLDRTCASSSLLMKFSMKSVCRLLLKPASGQIPSDFFCCPALRAQAAAAASNSCLLY